MITIDGKVLRRSHDKGIGKAAIDMVSAWASANHLVLGQVKVDDKSNEITAIPELLRVLEVAGCIVTIAAIGCQTKIVEQIVDKEADYVLALKENQGRLYEDVELLFKIWKTVTTRPIGMTTIKPLIKAMGASKSANAGPFRIPRSCAT